MPDLKTLFAHSALLPEGWAEGVTVAIDSGGNIASVEAGLASAPAGAEVLGGVLLPGIPNCHSHAFQRAMVGLTETRTAGTGNESDSFWSWRDAMYQLLGKIGPESLQAIAGQLYVEMLKQGYTSVAEFHYLHHDAAGKAYADPAEMSWRIIAAAQGAGMRLTHLPVLYCHSDFGAMPPEQGQRRFVHSIDAYQHMLQALNAHKPHDDMLRIGIAPHSLRAVSEPLLAAAIECLDALDSSGPIHIHISEQQKEVDGCLAFYGTRPVARLLEKFAVNKRWCLVHATHVDAVERRDLAASGAVAGLCPTTEANLGDGLFPAVDYLAADGRIAIGSDSQVCLDPVQELRLLEYGQRLLTGGRAQLATGARASVGESLFREVTAGGAQALGINAGTIVAGAAADLLVVDDQHPTLYGRQQAALLDSWIFGSNSTAVKHVMVAGQWRVRDGRHPQEEQVFTRYRQAIDGIAG